MCGEKTELKEKVMVKAGVKVEKVNYGQGRGEMVSVNVRSVKDTIKVMAVYVAPRSNKWLIIEYEQMPSDTK